MGRSNFIEIRIQLPNAILRAVAYRSAAYASNSYIFIVWMLGTSFVLIVVAVAFLRTQIRPILRLSRAAEAFGKGRDVDFRPRGAREVRQAGYAFKADADRHGGAFRVDFQGDPVVRVRPDAFKRCIGNLVANAQRHAKSIVLDGTRDGRFLTIHVDDDGPGIPAASREDVFRPFVRLDEARNQDAGGTGLGLSIARDIARSHGGDITLGDSMAGGLRATVRIPV